MLVKDVMSNEPHFMHPTDTIEEAAKKMKQWGTGFVPVGEDDRLLGAVTDRDIVLRAVAQGRDIMSTTLGDILSEHIEYCFDDEALEEAAKHMEEKQIRRLVVLNREKRMVGILSLGDIACKAKDNNLSGEILDFISKKAA